MSTTQLNDVSTGAPFSHKGRQASGASLVEDQSGAPGKGFIPMPAPNTPYTPGRWFQANCTVAGIVDVVAPDGSQGVFMLEQGTNILNVEVVSWSYPAQGAAAATFYNII